MDVQVKDMKRAGSCNFCKRGKLNDSKNGLVYPYENVFEITGDTIQVRMCEVCYKELQTRMKYLK